MILMKIAIFTDAFMPQISGVTMTLSKFIDYLDQNGIQYRVFTLAYKNTQSSRRIKRFSSFKFIFYPDVRLPIPNYTYIKRVLDKFKPDIIHLVTEFNLGLCGLRYAKANNIPVVSFYETNIPQYMKYYHLKPLENTTWQYLKWFHTSCDKNYCPSITTQKMLTAKGLKNVQKWHRGVETDKFNPDKRDEALRKSVGADGKVLFLYAGRVSVEKDLYIIMEMAKRLNTRYRDKMQYVIVGGGPYLKKLKKEAPPNVIFTGFVDSEMLLKFYASADVFIQPSPTETLGFVVLEALSSGLPVIGCFEGGIAENLVDNYNGIACREKNIDDFCNAAERLINDEALRKTLSVNARNYVLNKDLNNAFNDLIESFNEVITLKKEKAAVNGTTGKSEGLIKMPLKKFFKVFKT
jgi:glycosyltransferase involved in cell wall biosynthesis